MIGMQSGTDILKNNLAVYFKVEYILPYGLAIPLLGFYPRALILN